MIRTHFKQFLQDERGVAAIEYALIGALIAIVIVGAVQVVGTNACTLYNNVANDLANAFGFGGNAPGC